MREIWLSSCRYGWILGRQIWITLEGFPWIVSKVFCNHSLVRYFLLRPMLWLGVPMLWLVHLLFWISWSLRWSQTMLNFFFLKFCNFWFKEILTNFIAGSGKNGSQIGGKMTERWYFYVHYRLINFVTSQMKVVAVFFLTLFCFHCTEIAALFFNFHISWNWFDDGGLSM